MKACSGLLIAVALLAGGCGTLARPPATAVTRVVAPLPWPNASDYGTIKTAVAVRDQALFRESDWRRKSFAAVLAARTLLTVRVAPGPCASYVAELYGTLRDLMDAAAGENWRPLVRIVRAQPALASVCLAPRYHLTKGPRVSLHGMPPHGGFALGLERWVTRLIGAANIRETTLFPRDLGRLAP